MSNGKIVDEIRKLTDGNTKIPAIVRDRLMLAALADIYEKLDDLDTMRPWVKGVKWLTGVIGVLIVYLLWAILTHTFTF